MKLQSSGTLELPDRKLVEEYVDIYNATVFRRVFPVVNTALFTETINAAYGHRDASQYYQSASAKACIYSFLAFCSVLNIRGRTAPTVDSEGYALKAQCLLPQVLREPASLDGLQTAVMIVSVVSLIIPFYIALIFACLLSYDNGVVDLFRMKLSFL